LASSPFDASKTVKPHSRRYSAKGSGLFNALY
jgi:hypothetical protein